VTISTRRLSSIAFLSAVGIALFVIESYIPMPFPFLKIGLANLSTVIALMMFGTVAASIVAVVRVVVGSLFIGSFMGPAFLLAMSAGVSSAMLMALVKRTTGNLFSALGISLIGAVTHVLVQLLVVRYFFVQSQAVFSLVPILLTTSLVGGLIVGFISLRLLSALKDIRL
jgi:heptaprenyl diphosphate synthase